jgi:4-amino-4-deoxy-L-arabinose transferase-like glycosyltransferase
MSFKATVNELENKPSRPPNEDATWLHRTLWLVGGLLLWRSFYAGVVPLDLIADEAYYWNWSRQLDWCYYSKPPMVAWIIHLATLVGGHAPWVVRMPAVILGTTGLLFIYALGSRIYGPRTGFWAAAATAATPGNSTLSLIMTIDAPFMFCWSGALYSFWRLLERRHGKFLWAVATTFAVGLGLLSKQTMLVFFPLAGVFLLLSPDHRGELARYPVWLTALCALVFLTPMVWWNMHQGWVTLQHTSGHFKVDPFLAITRLRTFAEYLVGQGGVISPISCLLFTAVVFYGLIRFKSIKNPDRYLLCFSAIPLIFVLILSLVQRVEPNWPGPFYASGIVFLAGWATGQADFAAYLVPLRRWFVPGVVVGAGFCLVLYALPYGLPLLGLSGTRIDPTVRLRAWHQLAREVDAQLASFPRPKEMIIITTTGRGLASALSFYMENKPHVFPYNETGIVRSQYDVWGFPKIDSGKNAMLITHAHEQVPEALKKKFRHLERVALLTRSLGAGRKWAYHIWRGVDFQGFPATRD